MGGETIELMLPESAIAVEPVGHVPQRGGREAHATHSAVPPAFHKVRALEHYQVLADRGKRNGKGAGELADRGLAAREARHDRAARRIRERTEHEIETRL